MFLTDNSIRDLGPSCKIPAMVLSNQCFLPITLWSFVEVSDVCHPVSWTLLWNLMSSVKWNKFDCYWGFALPIITMITRANKTNAFFWLIWRSLKVVIITFEQSGEFFQKKELIGPPKHSMIAWNQGYPSIMIQGAQLLFNILHQVTIIIRNLGNNQVIFVKYHFHH